MSSINPIEYLSLEAIENLEIIQECDSDEDEESILCYDKTHEEHIDEEWFKWYCSACGCEREAEMEPCIDCEAKYINHFK